MELTEIRIKRNTYEAVIDGIEPGRLGGIATFRSTGTGTPSVASVALTDQQIDAVLAALADGTGEAARGMLAGISAEGIRSANAAPHAPAGFDKIARAAVAAGEREGGAA